MTSNQMNVPGSDVEKPFVNHLEIVRTIPCLADPGKIRFTAKFDRDVADIFPYLNTILQGAIYNHAGKSLTLHKQGRLITLYNRHLTAARIDDTRDAHQVIGWLTDLINECHGKRLTISPSYERRDNLNIIDIVRLLPGTNCKKCKQATCLSFAALVAAEKASIMACPELFQPEYKEKRDELLALLRAGGYSTPDLFTK